MRVEQLNTAAYSPTSFSSSSKTTAIHSFERASLGGRTSGFGDGFEWSSGTNFRLGAKSGEALFGGRAASNDTIELPKGFLPSGARIRGKAGLQSSQNFVPKFAEEDDAPKSRMMAAVEERMKPPYARKPKFSDLGVVAPKEPIERQPAPNEVNPEEVLSGVAKPNETTLNEPGVVKNSDVSFFNYSRVPLGAIVNVFM
ncbi:MAG: hypothetical protein GF419_11750 [Ignavibacteriales bacterium]|nr:hypothetical protein [Ignavibacteriales bacterium]